MPWVTFLNAELTDSMAFNVYIHFLISLGNSNKGSKYCINGANFVKDFTANITNFIGGRADEYEQELINTRADAITEMIERAEKVGANAIIGVKIDYEPLGGDSIMLMVVASGTAVVI